VADDAVYREWLYVALSRARDRTTLVACGAGGDQLQRLAELATRTRAQSMALEHSPAPSEEELLTHHIAPRPSKVRPALRWDQALEAVTAYRERHPDLSSHELIGAPPRDHADRLHWTLAERAVARAAEAREATVYRERWVAANALPIGYAITVWFGMVAA